MAIRLSWTVSQYSDARADQGALSRKTGVHFC
jgi:hypothetical protein